MTHLTIILWSMGFVILFGALRGRAGSALTDVIILLFLFTAILIVDLVLRRFMDTGNIGWNIAALIAGAAAMDAVYGFMAPDRKRRRDRKLRDLMRRRRRV